MSTSAAIFTTALDAVDAAVATMPSSLPAVKGLDDDALLAVQRRIAPLAGRWMPALPS